MDDRRGGDHDELIALLPDYAVGRLGDGDLWRVAAHLDTCATCQRELAFLLETVVLLAEVSPPSPAVKREVLARVGGAPALARIATTPPAPIAAWPPGHPLPPAIGDQPVLLPPRPEAAGGAGPVVGWQGREPVRFRPASLALVAALLLVVVGFVVWEAVLEREDDDPDERAIVAALLLDPAAAHPLADSELDVGAGGVMFTDPTSEIAYLVAHGLPATTPDQEYRVWLFTPDGQRIDGGPVSVDADGVVQAIVRAPSAFADYWAVGVSLEPAGGSPEPTSPLVVGGWLR